MKLQNITYELPHAPSSIQGNKCTDTSLNYLDEIIPIRIRREVAVSSVDGWVSPKAFSLPTSARSYHCLALSYLPWSLKTDAMLSTVSSVDGWSSPKAFSLPASARLYHCMASSYLL